MGGHHSPAMQKDEWLTPPHIIKALGVFDLDPCAPADHRRPWDMASRHYSIEDDGLAQPWAGRIWCNPPYGLGTAHWLKRLADHGDGMALIFARTETTMFFEHIWSRADAVLFLRGRLHFHHVGGTRAAVNAGAPSVLAAYGEANVQALQASGLEGQLIRIKESDQVELDMK
ncbi:MAG: adenine methyltransferase [Burkholderiaceae bacterium]|nr:MAG: adenine methyltransferase [Burkholderiaceae bacterium]TBR76884.1 MAG: adenine methyltransferase [Burkholderiaceae bacterium]